MTFIKTIKRTFQLIYNYKYNCNIQIIFIIQVNYIKNIQKTLKMYKKLLKFNYERKTTH